MLFLFTFATLILPLLASAGSEIAGICFDQRVDDIRHHTCSTPSIANTTCYRRTGNNKLYCTKPFRTIQTVGSVYNRTNCIPKSGTYPCSFCSAVGGSVTCDGNSLWCQSHLCNSASNCTCSLQTYSKRSEILATGTWSLGEKVSVGYTVDPVLYITLPFNRRPFGYDMTGNDKRQLDNIQKGVKSSTSVTLEQPNIVVTTPEPDYTKVSTTKDGLQNLFACAETQCILRLPDTYFLNPGSMIVRVFINDTLDAESTLTVTPYIKCNIPRCVFCEAMYQDFTCFPWQFQMFIISACIVIFLGGGLMVWYILKCSCAFSCCKKCRKQTHNKISISWDAIKDKMKRKLSKNKNAQDDGTEDVVDRSRDYEMRPIEPDIGLIRENPPASLFRVALILGLISLALGQTSCSSGITVTASNNLCYANGVTETCQVTIENLFTIPAPGLSACFTIMKPDLTPIGKIDINYDQMIQVAPLQTLYYTTIWSGISISDKQCPWEHMCGSCASYNPLTDPGACGGSSTCLLAGITQMYQGMSRCDSQCGCAGCGCFACDASCVYSRAAIVPSGLPYSVNRPVSVQLRPQLRVNFTHNGASEVTPVNVLNAETQVGLNFTITIQGSLAGSTTNFAGQNVVCGPEGCTMGSTSDPNSPVIHSVGDIQANDPSQLGAFGQYQLAAGLWTALPTSTATNYVFAAAGFGARASHDYLPTVRGSTLWGMSWPNLVGVDQAPGAVVAILKSNGPIIISRTVNIVCPEILENSGNLTGCYSCDQGATIRIRARSRCSGGMAVVTTSGSYTVATTSIVLTTDYQEFSIRVTSGSNQNTGTITLTNGAYSDSETIEGELVAEDLIVNNNQTFTNNTVNNGFNNFADWFSKLGDVFKGLLITGMVVGAVIASLIVAWLVYKGIQSFKAARLEARYQSLASDQRQKMIHKMEMRNLKPEDFD